MRQRQVVLVLGVPRSGSTWLADILASAPDADLVMEPDNEKTSIPASFLKKEIPRFPKLSPQESGPQELQILWDCAFRSNWAPLLSRGRLSKAICQIRTASRESAIARKTTETVVDRDTGSSHSVLRSLCACPGGLYRPLRIIKSVHAVLYPEWIVERYRPSSTLIIMRHPMAVLQSWRRLKMPDAYRLTRSLATGDAMSQKDSFVRMAEQLCVMYASLKMAAERNPDWQMVWHEKLCEDPDGQMRDVANRCGIGWDARMERCVALMNQAGEGYKPRRNAASEIGKWRGEVAQSEIDAVKAIFERSGLADFI